MKKKQSVNAPNKAVNIVEKVARANGNRNMAKLKVNLRDSGAGMKPGKKVTQ